MSLDMTSNPVTDRNSALRTPHSAKGPLGQASPGETPLESDETPHSAPTDAPDSALTDGDGPGFVDQVRAVWARVWPWLRVNFRPPLVWTEPPASLAALSHYAHSQPWTSRSYGFVRAAGVWWCRLVAMPISIVAYYAAWFCQRFTRVAALVVLYIVLAHTAVGLWLPWPSWLP